MAQPGEPYDPNPSLPPGQYPVPYQPPYPHYPQYPGYPPPYGYPPPNRPSRPGVATAASVLGYVAAGLLIAAGLLLFFGASIVAELDEHSSILSTEFVVDGIINLIAAGLLIAGAVSFGNRNPQGRVMLSVGCGIVLGAALYWIVRQHRAGDAFWAFVFAALAIVALSLAWSAAANQWIRGTLTTKP